MARHFLLEAFSLYCLSFMRIIFSSFFFFPIILDEENDDKKKTLLSTNIRVYCKNFCIVMLLSCLKGNFLSTSSCQWTHILVNFVVRFVWKWDKQHVSHFYNSITSITIPFFTGLVYEKQKCTIEYFLKPNLDICIWILVITSVNNEEKEKSGKKSMIIKIKHKLC